MFRNSHFEAMNLTDPCCICYKWHGLLSVCVSCSRSVVAYHGRREYASMPNAPMGSCVKLLGGGVP